MGEKAGKSRKKKTSPKCLRKKKIMLTYGLIQLGAKLIATISLASIAINLLPNAQKADVFNSCIEETQKEGKTSALSVHYCNGGS